MLKKENVHLMTDEIWDVGWSIFKYQGRNFYSKNWKLRKLSVQHLRGLARELPHQLLEQKQECVLLYDLHLLHLAIYLLIGCCQRITPCSLIHLFNGHKSIYLSFVSPYTPCYFQLIVHVWSWQKGGSDSSMLQIYHCHWWLLHQDYRKQVILFDQI